MTAKVGTFNTSLSVVAVFQPPPLLHYSSVISNKVSHKFVSVEKYFVESCINELMTEPREMDFV